MNRDRCHAAVVINRQNVKIGKHHILVDRTAHEKSRARGVPADATDELVTYIYC